MSVRHARPGYPRIPGLLLFRYRCVGGWGAPTEKVRPNSSMKRRKLVSRLSYYFIENKAQLQNEAEL